MTKNTFEYDQITLHPASLDDYPTIQNMGRFYAYDMSEFMANEPHWEMPENGLYECIDLKKYWQTEDAFPFLVRYKAELVGFIIVDKKGSTNKVDFNMAQFFITRKFTGKGIGTYVACHCFDAFKGIWEVMVMPQNKAAYQFWSKVIAKYTNNMFTEGVRSIAHFNNREYTVFSFKS